MEIVNVVTTLFAWGRFQNLFSESVTRPNNSNEPRTRLCRTCTHLFTLNHCIYHVLGLRPGKCMLTTFYPYGKTAPLLRMYTSVTCHWCIFFFYLNCADEKWEAHTLKHTPCRKTACNQHLRWEQKELESALSFQLIKWCFQCGK